MAEFGPKSETLRLRKADLVLQLERVPVLHEVQRSFRNPGHVQARGQDIAEHAVDQYILRERLGDPGQDGELRLLQH